MNTKETKPPWADEPTPLCDPFYGRWATMCTSKGTVYDLARDLERRLRWCQEKLRQISKKTVGGRQSLAASVAKGALAELEKST